MWGVVGFAWRFTSVSWSVLFGAPCNRGRGVSNCIASMIEAWLITSLISNVNYCCFLCIIIYASKIKDMKFLIIKSVIDGSTNIYESTRSIWALCPSKKNLSLNPSHSNTTLRHLSILFQVSINQKSNIFNIFCLSIKQRKMDSRK